MRDHLDLHAALLVQMTAMELLNSELCYVYLDSRSFECVFLAVCLSDSASVCLLVFGAVWVSVCLSVYLSGSFLEHQMRPGLHLGIVSRDVGRSVV